MRRQNLVLRAEYFQSSELDSVRIVILSGKIMEVPIGLGGLPTKPGCEIQRAIFLLRKHPPQLQQLKWW